VKFSGVQYLLGFAQPNFYFHATTAYTSCATTASRSASATSSAIHEIRDLRRFHEKHSVEISSRVPQPADRRRRDAGLARGSTSPNDVRLPPQDPRHSRRVRIFTPKTRLPFAGHPTVARPRLAVLGS